MEIRMPAAAREIIEQLNAHGYEAYVVGGCVRDMMLGREPEDWDITTDALPKQVKQVFYRTIDTGIQHGTVTVMMGKAGYEVTTYRIDGEYSDGRHPDTVLFTPSLIEDLKRRDFTMNAMAYSDEKGVVDAFGGVEDLTQGIIRCVGTAMDRFREDALRILRAIRFSAQLGFAIEEETYKAIGAIAPNILHVSKERIQAELTKLLLSRHPEHIDMVYETGISQYISEEFHRLYSQRMECAKTAGGTSFIPVIPVSVRPVKHMRWAAFLRGCSPNQAVDILKDLKLDNDTIYKVKTLVTWQNQRLVPDKYSIRLAMSKMESALFDDLLLYKMCLSEAAAGRMEGGLFMDACLETPEELACIKGLAEEVRCAGECISLKMLAVTGNDIIEAGVKPGKEVGEVLSRLLELVLREPEQNTKDILLRNIK